MKISPSRKPFLLKVFFYVIFFFTEKLVFCNNLGKSTHTISTTEIKSLGHSQYGQDNSGHLKSRDRVLDHNCIHKEKKHRALNVPKLTESESEDLDEVWGHGHRHNKHPQERREVYNYTDAVIKGKQFQIDFCNVTCPYEENITIFHGCMNSKPVCSMCQCDEKCSEFGDCCLQPDDSFKDIMLHPEDSITLGSQNLDGIESIDSKNISTETKFREDEQNRLQKDKKAGGSKYTCVQVGIELYVFVVASCPKNDDTHLRKARSKINIDMDSETFSSRDSKQYQDRLSECNTCLETPGAPSFVTSTLSNVTYCNMACLKCNENGAFNKEDSLTSFITWPMKRYCRALGNMTSDKINHGNIKPMDIGYGQNSTTAASSDDMNSACTVNFIIPDGAVVRNCDRRAYKESVVDSCPEKFDDKLGLEPSTALKMVELCGAYSAPVYTETQVFRNLFCFMCQGHALQPCKAKISQYTEEDPFPDTFKVTFSLITAISDHDINAGYDENDDAVAMEDDDGMYTIRLDTGAAPLVDSTSSSVVVVQLNTSSVTEGMQLACDEGYWLNVDSMECHKIQCFPGRNLTIVTTDTTGPRWTCQRVDDHIRDGSEATEAQPDRVPRVLYIVSIHWYFFSSSPTPAADPVEIRNTGKGEDRADGDWTRPQREALQRLLVKADPKLSRDQVGLGHDPIPQSYKGHHCEGLLSDANCIELVPGAGSISAATIDGSHTRGLTVNKRNRENTYMERNGRTLKQNAIRSFFLNPQLRKYKITRSRRALDAGLQDRDSHTLSLKSKTVKSGDQIPYAQTDTNKLESDVDEIWHNNQPKNDIKVKVTNQGRRTTSLDWKVKRSYENIAKASSRTTSSRAFGNRRQYRSIHNDNGSIDSTSSSQSYTNEELKASIVQYTGTALMNLNIVNYIFQMHEVDLQFETSTNQNPLMPNLTTSLYFSVNESDDYSSFEKSIKEKFSGNISLMIGTNQRYAIALLAKSDTVSLQSDHVYHFSKDNEGNCCNSSETNPQDGIDIFHEFQCTSNYDKVIHFDGFTSCPYVAFNISEFNLTSKLTLVQQNSRLRFKRYQYIVDNKDVLVCVDTLRYLYRTSSARPLNTLLYAEIILTITVLPISMICLAITFVTYAIFPSLQSLPGKNNMVLVAWLFIGQGLLLASSVPEKGSSACAVLGVIIHFSWLSASIWTSVCSFHMFHVFVLRQATPRSTRNNRWYLYRYLFICNALVISIVISVITTNLYISGGSSIGYGHRVCYLNTFLAVGLAFFLPLSITVVFNTTLFIITVYTISKIEDVKRQAGQERRNVYIYIRLSSLTGMCWILALLAEIPGLSFLRIASVLVNGSQGVLLFLSYTCNRRVVRMWNHQVRTRNASTTQRLTDSSQQATASSSV